MPPLLQRLSPWRRRSRPAAPPAPPPRSRRRRRFWLCCLLILAVVLAGYFWVTSARILGEPVTLSYGPGDPVFHDTLGPLLGADFSSGNRIETLVNGAEFFPAMLAAIRGAQHTITLETYIWSSGQVSDDFIEALNERARQGVKVHVLADGIGTLRLSREDRRRMLDAGVEFLVYGREHWYQIKPNINHRTHRKILVVDGRVGFTGGMCIDDRWLGDADSEKVWRETQLRLRGPVVRQMQSVFATNWLQTTSRLLVGPGYFPAIDPREEGALAQCYKSGPDEDPENARISYLMAIAAARSSIKIAHGYFVPDDLAIEMLVAACQRGVKVQVIVPAVNDSRFGRAASRSRWGKLLAAGAEFHAYQPAMFHCKVMIVDDLFVTVGSVNFDNRSFSINDEVSVNILDRDVARENARIFAADLRRSRHLTREEFESRPLYVKLFDHFCGLFRSQL